MLLLLSLVSCALEEKGFDSTAGDTAGPPVSDIANAINPGTVGFTDADGDSYSVSDCDDTNAAVHPGATEVCNDVDDDCDGIVDDEASGSAAWYADADRDGYGDPASYVYACSAPAEYANNNTDCDDTNAAIHPDATEVCNGIDDDCDEVVDDGVIYHPWYIDFDGDGWGSGLAVLACDRPSGWYVAQDGDCITTDSTVFPGAQEYCDGKDDNCNGVVDDDADATTPGARQYNIDRDVDYYGDMFGAPQYVCSVDPEIEYFDSAGVMTWASENDLDCNDRDSMTNPSVIDHPGDGIDQNCDGTDG